MGRLTVVSPLAYPSPWVFKSHIQYRITKYLPILLHILSILVVMPRLLTIPITMEVYVNSCYIVLFPDSDPESLYLCSTAATIVDPTNWDKTETQSQQSSNLRI